MRQTLTIATLALLAGACGGTPPRTAATPVRIGGCSALPIPAAPAESATVVLTWPVDLSNAPNASNPAEGFVFAHVYESLTRVDCLGREVPSRWPGGTGPYRISGDGTAPAPSGASRRATLRLEPVDATVAPRLTIHAVAESDARDLIDAGADLLLTDDPALTAYAGTRADVATVPLAWDRAWVLLTPRYVTPSGGSVPAPDSVAERTRAFRAALARDAVRAEARASQGPYWWTDLARCGVSPVSGVGPSRQQTGFRIAFRRDDPVARGLAERLVAVAGAGSQGARDSMLALVAPGLAAAGRRLTAVAMAPNDLATALREGSELAFVVPLPRRSLARCNDAARLRALAPWVASTIDTGRVSDRISPLIDTRLLAVVRRDRLGLTLTWDSTVVVTPRTGGAAGSAGVRR